MSVDGNCFFYAIMYHVEFYIEVSYFLSYEWIIPQINALSLTSLLLLHFMFYIIDSKI